MVLFSIAMPYTSQTDFDKENPLTLKHVVVEVSTCCSSRSGLPDVISSSLSEITIGNEIARVQKREYRNRRKMASVFLM
jgi:hypothetical protein